MSPLIPLSIPWKENKGKVSSRVWAHVHLELLQTGNLSQGQQLLGSKLVHVNKLEIIQMWQNPLQL